MNQETLTNAYRLAVIALLAVITFFEMQQKNEIRGASLYKLIEVTATDMSLSEPLAGTVMNDLLPITTLHYDSLLGRYSEGVIPVRITD